MVESSLKDADLLADNTEREKQKVIGHRIMKLFEDN